MVRKLTRAIAAPFLALLTLFALLLLPGALANAADLFSHGVITLPPSPSRPAGGWHRVLSTQAEWEDFYRERAGAGANVPTIDFARYRVVVGGLGLAPLSTSLVVQSIANDSSVVYVDVLVASVESGCTVLAGMAYPTLAIVIPQSTMPVRVTARPATYACSGEHSAR